MLVNKKILWIGVGATKYHNVYHSQICKSYLHDVDEIFSLDTYKLQDYHCCFIFSGVIDAKLFNVKEIKLNNTILCFDSCSLLKHRKTNGQDIQYLLESDFCIFSNDLFADYCVRFNLFSYRVSHSEVLPPAVHSCDVFNELCNSINEISFWMRHHCIQVSTPTNYTIIGTKDEINLINFKDLMSNYTYVSCVTQDYLIQVFYPKSSTEGFYRQFLCAMLRRMGAAKSITIYNRYKPLKGLLGHDHKCLENVLACTSKIYSTKCTERVYYLIKEVKWAN